jgi:hypothetical protein
VQITTMPSYVERFVLTRLEHKLHDEYGEPPPPVHRDPEARRPAPGGDDEHAREDGASSSAPPSGHEAGR